jgi:hypothetical protein
MKEDIMTSNNPNYANDKSFAIHDASIKPQRNFAVLKLYEALFTNNPIHFVCNHPIP